MLARASKALVTPVGEHRDALQEMRTEIQAAVADAGKEIVAAIGITVAIVAIAAVASAGLAAPAAAGGGAVVTAEIVATTAGIIKNAVSISRLLAIFGAVVVAGTASGAFTAIPDLTTNGINAALTAIAAMTVHTTADDGETGPSGDDSGKASDQAKTWSDIFKDGRTPKASELEKYAQEQGWTRSKTENGPIKYTDEDGVVRITIKKGSDRAPGSSDPHVEMRNPDGVRIDPDGNPVTRKSPGNHTPIEMDIP